MTFDDRLEKAEGEDELLETAEEIAEELGAEHSPDDVCSMCVRDTPLARTYARDISKANKVRSLVNEITDKGVPRMAAQEVEDAYMRAYRENCDDPEYCDTCLDQNTKCGHEEAGRDCPAN